MCQLLITKKVCQAIDMGKYLVHQGALLVVVCEKTVLKQGDFELHFRGRGGGGGGGNHQMMT